MRGKSILTLLILFAFLAAALAACGGQPAPAPAKEAPKAAGDKPAEKAEKAAPAGDKKAAGGKYSVTIASSQTSGTMFQWVAPAASIINKFAEGVSANALPTLGTSENMKLIAAGEVQMASTSGISLYQALNGVGEFEGKKFDGSQVVLAMYYDAWQIAGGKDLAANSLAELKGKRVSLNVKGSGGYSNNQAYLKALDINGETYFAAKYLSQGDSSEGIKNGALDAYLYTGGPGAAGLLENANSKMGLKLISLTEAEVKKIEAALPGVKQKVIPKGTYPGVNYDVTTVGGTSALVARKDVPEDVVYKITRALDEHRADLVAALSVASYSSAENTVKDFDKFLPLHPGAIKYFKEKGLLK